MAKLGQWNHLNFIREIAHGYILDGNDIGDILLPKKYCKGIDTSEDILVFVYTDSEDRPVATTETPLAVAGEFARLKCVDKTHVGYFFDLGISKHLLVPFAQLDVAMEVDRYYVVRVYLDKVSSRMAGSTKLNRWLNDSSVRYFEDQEVDLMIAKRTDIGYKAIIDNSDWGLLYENEVFQDLRIGQKIKGYIHETRPDGKIDLKLYPATEDRVSSLSSEILASLEENGGVLDISDKTPPEELRDYFNTSKKTFKKALGQLYKNKLIEILPTSIRLVAEKK